MWSLLAVVAQLVVASSVPLPLGILSTTPTPRQATPWQLQLTPIQGRSVICPSGRPQDGGPGRCMLPAWDQTPPPCPMPPAAPNPGCAPPVPWVPPPPPPIDPTNAITFTMIMDTSAPQWFTAAQLGMPVDQIPDPAYCEGRFVKGSYRYYTSNRMPTALAGILVPQPPLTTSPPEDVNGTLELDGQTVSLFSGAMVRDFKAVNATSSPTEITWTCQLRGRE